MLQMIMHFGREALPHPLFRQTQFTGQRQETRF